MEWYVLIDGFWGSGDDEQQISDNDPARFQSQLSAMISLQKNIGEAATLPLGDVLSSEGERLRSCV